VLVDEWVETLWTVLQVRPKTVHDYKRLYRRHLKDLIGQYSFEEVPIITRLSKKAWAVS